MSAPALRAPAGTWRAARHYLGMLGRGGGAWGIAVGVLVACLNSVGADGRNSFAGVQSVLGLAFFLPLLHWRQSSRAGALHDAMPLDRTRHDLVRVLCGAAWACAAILVVVGLFMAASLLGRGPRFGGYPWWYPFPALSAGLLMYLFGSAVWLRAARPGRVLFVAYGLFFFFWFRVVDLVAGDGGSDTFSWATVATQWSSEGGLQATPEQWLVGSITWLAAAWSIVWICAGADRWLEIIEAGRAGRERPAPGRRAPLKPPAAPVARPAHATPGPRRVPGLGVALRREFLLVGRRMPWLMFFVLLLAWMWYGTESAVSNQAPPMVRNPRGFNVLEVFFLLPVLVWLDERGAGQKYHDALPVDVVARRALRVLAGAAWLGIILVPLIASPVAGDLAAGKVGSLGAVPARVWLGVPGAALLAYLLGSLPVLLAATRPVLWTFGWWIGFGLLGRLPGMAGISGWEGWGYSPWAALYPLGRYPWAEQSWAPALALWLAVALVAAAAAAAHGARVDRTGRGVRPQPARTTGLPAAA